MELLLFLYIQECSVVSTLRSCKFIHIEPTYFSCGHSQIISCANNHDFVNQASFPKQFSFLVSDIGKGLGQHLVEQSNSDVIDHALLFHIAAEAHRGSYGKKVWQCEYCGKTFTNPRNKRMHVEAVHGPGDASYTCVCGKAYKYTHNLYRHRKHCTVYQLAQQPSSVQFCWFCVSVMLSDYVQMCRIPSH